ncbi:hypothetical protein AB0K43_28465 [Kitasatospora sp. NPDC049258]|uniref:hypothetical protein n=1 Tax=Kitasatospora sp. NPDC049258 TaxID=3155394 RepID=UPI0034312D3F
MTTTRWASLALSVVLAFGGATLAAAPAGATTAPAVVQRSAAGPPAAAGTPGAAVTAVAAVTDPSATRRAGTELAKSKLKKKKKGGLFSGILGIVLIALVLMIAVPLIVLGLWLVRRSRRRT